MKIHSIRSWNELNERLYEGSWQEPLGRFRANFAFRGGNVVAGILGAMVVTWATFASN